MLTIANKKQIGIKLKELREGSGLTQDTLAEKLEYSVDTISRIETGKAPMTEKFRTAASKFFNVNESYFFLFDENKPASEKQILLQEIDKQLSELDIEKLKAMESIIRTVKMTWSK